MSAARDIVADYVRRCVSHKDTPPRTRHVIATAYAAGFLSGLVHASDNREQREAQAADAHELAQRMNSDGLAGLSTLPT